MMRPCFCSPGPWVEALDEKDPSGTRFDVLDANGLRVATVSGVDLEAAANANAIREVPALLDALVALPGLPRRHVQPRLQRRSTPPRSTAAHAPGDLDGYARGRPPRGSA